MGIHLHSNNRRPRDGRNYSKGGTFMKTRKILQSYINEGNPIPSDAKVLAVEHYEELLDELGAGEIREEKVRKYFELSLSEIERRTRKMLRKTLNKRLARAAEGKPIMMYHYGIYTKLAEMEIFLTKEEIQTLLSKDKVHALEYNRVLIKKYL